MKPSWVETKLKLSGPAEPNVRKAEPVFSMNAPDGAPVLLLLPSRLLNCNALPVNARSLFNAPVSTFT